MTDRIKGLVVTLTEDVRKDDVEALCSAIEQFRGVCGVATEVANLTDHLNRTRIEWEIRRKVLEALGFTPGTKT